jgi:hypothetical protein
MLAVKFFFNYSKHHLILIIETETLKGYSDALVTLSFKKYHISVRASDRDSESVLRGGGPRPADSESADYQPGPGLG